MALLLFAGAPDSTGHVLRAAYFFPGSARLVRT